MIIINVNDTLNISSNHSGIRNNIARGHILHKDALRLEIDDEVMIRDSATDHSAVGKVIRIDDELNIVEALYDKTEVFQSDNTPASVQIKEKKKKSNKKTGPFAALGLSLGIAALTLFMLNPLAYTAMVYIGIVDDNSGYKFDFFEEVTPQLYGAAFIVISAPFILVWLTRSHWEARLSATVGNTMTVFLTLTGLMAGFLLVVAIMSLLTYFTPTTDIYLDTDTTFDGLSDSSLLLKEPFSVTTLSTLFIIALGWIPITLSLLLTHLGIKPRLEQLKNAR